MSKGWARLADVGYVDISLVGGKAASLGEMFKAGLPVPDGIVITTEAYGQPLEGELEQAILQAFDTLGAQRVAVRSSAVAEDSSDASWAGQLETVLNVTRSGLLEAVRYCWDSMRSQRAQNYAATHKVTREQQKVAVVVQAMVDSEQAGVMFTINPVENNKDEILIEAIYGLGELLVQGVSTPETIILNKQSGKITDRSNHQQTEQLVYRDGQNIEVPLSSELQDRPILTDERIQQLAGLAKDIEQYYGAPQDIEWAMTGNKMYIVQSRPITTLK